jgi:hypothetical protein
MAFKKAKLLIQKAPLFLGILLYIAEPKPKQP